MKGKDGGRGQELREGGREEETGGEGGNKVEGNGETGRDGEGELVW